MIVIIVTAVILVGSLVGLGVILFKKIPLLVKMPEVQKGIHEPVVVKIKNGAKNLPGAIPGVRDLPYELYLQKVLSRVRILTLKTEQKTGSWLEKLRQKSSRKNHGGDNYWEELKKAKKGD